MRRDLVKSNLSMLENFLSVPECLAACVRSRSAVDPPHFRSEVSDVVVGASPA